MTPARQMRSLAGHARCWVEKCSATELTGLLREGPGGDQLDGWPESMRIFARRECRVARPARPVRAPGRLALQPVGIECARRAARVAGPARLHRRCSQGACEGGGRASGPGRTAGSASSPRMICV